MRRFSSLTSEILLLEQVYRTTISHVEELKRRTKSEWTALNHAVVEHAVGKWRQRLQFKLEAHTLNIK